MTRGTDIISNLLAHETDVVRYVTFEMKTDAFQGIWLGLPLDNTACQGDRRCA